jgi:hypothetical protein
MNTEWKFILEMKDITLMDNVLLDQSDHIFVSFHSITLLSYLTRSHPRDDPVLHMI